MKQSKRYLYLTGILLPCSILLAVYQSSSQKEQPTAPQKHQQTKPQQVKPQQVTETKESTRSKEVAGIDKPTDDGFLLTSESQIENRTDTGIVVKHGEHRHFFFYSDLIGTKWDYLLPKNYKAGVATTTTVSKTSVLSQNTNQTVDNYVFNANDIVAEDANGYIVRHEDHYHYIFKSALGEATVHHLSSNHVHRPSVAPISPQSEGISGIDFRTSDGFLFDGTNISGVTSTGILVKHAGHLHPISFEALKNSKWAYLVEQYKAEVAPNVQQPTNEEDDEYQKKLTYLAKELNVDSSRIKKVFVDGKVAFEYPHEDHQHVILLKDIDLNQPFETPDNHIIGHEDGESFEQRKERLIKAYMDRFKVKRENITVDGNYMSIRHGDHAHVYKIDPNLPDDPERDVRTETTNLEVEKQWVYGPFYTENSNESLTRQGVYQKYNPEGIQNIKNYILLTFSTNSEYGDLAVNGTKTKRVYYLVRKDLNWEDLNIQKPEAIKQEGRFLKGWNAELPSTGKMDRQHQSFYVDFDKVKKQPTKNVYGPEDDVSDFDLSHYVPVQYSVIKNGRLKLGSTTQGGFTYFVNPNLTWKEAREQGLLQPEPIANEHYEFIDFRNIVFGGEQENDKVSSTISLAAFGSTAPYLGPYIAVNPSNPTDINDPSRHPNYYWHNPKNYVAVAFKAEEGGDVITRSGRGKSAVYLVRKGLSLTEAGILPPWVQATPGYTRDYNKPIVSEEEYDLPVTEDKVYAITFDKIDENDKKLNETANEWLPGDPLPNDRLPGDSLPGDILFDDLLPGEVLLDDSLIDTTTPNEVLPEETKPSDNSNTSDDSTDESSSTTSDVLIDR